MQNVRMQHVPPAADAGHESFPQPVRLEQARAWAARQLGMARVELEPVSQDASFRRYFRLRTAGRPLILMDAPPGREDSRPFLDIAARLRMAGVHAPAVLHFDLEQGFGLLEDLGNQLYRDIIDPDNADEHLSQLFAVLLSMATRVDCSNLPLYDDGRLQAELDLFTDWYLLRHKQRPLDPRELLAWRQMCGALRHCAAQQPQAFVHRDFHSCNLLYRAGQSPGVIDFQDAVVGPVSYDLASLLWDRYISWPRARLEAWIESYRKLLGAAVDGSTWLRWCDWIGLQRNFKIVGIFARLHYRDGKDGYLAMIPRFYAYLRDVLPRYPEFLAVQRMLEQAECEP
jgi:aminoglycoside/choline kinase family phosphotransferase